MNMWAPLKSAFRGALLFVPSLLPKKFAVQ